MTITKTDNDNHQVELTASDVDSAIRAFICACHPEYATGWVINSVDAQPTVALMERGF